MKDRSKLLKAIKYMGIYLMPHEEAKILSGNYESAYRAARQYISGLIADAEENETKE